MYRQNSFFSLDYVLELQPLTMIESIMTFIDYSIIDETFKRPFYLRGPKGYSVRALLNSLLVMQLEQIKTVKKLVKEIKTNLALRIACGFQVIGNVPSCSTFSRFIKKLSETNVLERTYQRMVRRAKTLGLIHGEHLSIDASKLDAFEHARPKSKIPENDPQFPHWGAKNDTKGNMIKWFGWKMHAVVDTKSGIPLGYIITPANIADCDMALPLMEKVKQDYEELFKPTYYLVDAGYDTNEIYQGAYDKYNAQVIAPLIWFK